MNYIERLITTKIAEALVGANLGDVTVDSDHGFDLDAKRFRAEPSSVDKIVEEADEFDEVWIFCGGDRKNGYGPYVYLIFGNGNSGWDVMTDYSMSVEPALKPVLEFIEKEAG